MDYVLGGVAALISGNVTPNRPRLLKKALTPTKHQPSPNVTPKSELVEDRSIFLSPTMQKKKAIIKKSPKRIFQNPDLETTDSNEGNLSVTSPKAEKVKKLLEDHLDSDSTINKSVIRQKSPKSKNTTSRESISSQEDSQNLSVRNMNENTPKKKKKKRNSLSNITDKDNTEQADTVNASNTSGSAKKSPKKMMLRRKSVADAEINITHDENISGNTNQDTENVKNENDKTKSKVIETENNQTLKKKNKKRKKKGKKKSLNPNLETANENVQNVDVTPKKKNKKHKKTIEEVHKPVMMETDNKEQNDDDSDDEDDKSGKINPNAVTNKDSDSEHDSDNEIESENEEINKEVFESAPAEESSDEEDEKEKKVEKPEKKEAREKNTEEEVKRTLFVGNVPFSSKCKKEIKKIFSKYGQIETIRIRTVPIKDGRFTPKLAVIKNELHPERSTVNVYVKYGDPSSVDQALAENNTVFNEHHLRVSRSDSTGAEHDPRCSVFVGNLPFAMEDDALRAKFEKCGEIQSVRIIRDKKTNAGKGFGYVNFLSKDGVELALNLPEEDLTIKNRIIRVKRCTQVTNKQRPSGNQTQQRGFKPGFQPRQGNQGRFQNDRAQRHTQGFQGRFQGQRSEHSNQGGFQGQRSEQGNQARFQGYGQGRQRMEQGNRGKFQDQGNQGRFQKDQEGGDGAYRRIMKKRKNQEGGEEPPSKRPFTTHINQPNKEKKARKEFVGMTAEKKKKRKFDKGQKKKKALSEILTK